MIVNFGIDCYPGGLRPDYYAKPVFEYLGIEYINPVSMCFGAWEWTVTVPDDFDYEAFSDWFISKTQELYEKGSIRGSIVSKSEEP